MLVGSGPVSLDLPDAQQLAIHRQPAAPAIADVAEAVRNALENPIGFPALRRALTPDDHVTIVVDEQLSDVATLVAPILEHLTEARIVPEAITLLCKGNAANQAWVERLPQTFSQVKVEQHDPQNRKRLSYLATTKKGRRVYLNRTAVDADQLVVLTRRYFDPLMGVGGGEGAIYPALADSDAQQAALGNLSMAAASSTAWPAQQEAAEVVWLLGAPFFVQMIDGQGGETVHVLCGLIDTCAVGQRLLNARWRVEVDRLAEVVIAQVGGDPARHTFADVANALACACRVVAPEGRIIVVSGGAPDLEAAGQLLREADTPARVLELLKKQQPLNSQAAFQWASAAQQANLYLVSALPSEMVEELFMTPLEHVGQVDRLIGDKKFLYLPDADKTLAVVHEPAKAHSRPKS